MLHYSDSPELKHHSFWSTKRKESIKDEAHDTPQKWYAKGKKQQGKILK